jgi:hypothetical protein
MAIYHCSVKMISRSTGRSSVGAAAYRSGEKIKNERDDVTHDYTRKGGIIYSEILLPQSAPREYFSMTYNFFLFTLYTSWGWERQHTQYTSRHTNISGTF